MPLVMRGHVVVLDESLPAHWALMIPFAGVSGRVLIEL